MRVKSPIAEIDFIIGEIRRDGDTLVISGDPKSSIDVEIRMAPRDAAQMLGAVMFNPAAVLYFLSLPFRMKRKRASAAAGENEARHPFESLNKPW